MDMNDSVLLALAMKKDSTGGGSGVDVTASVGQTIVVEEVDANGKPTKWKSADYQPRTHWTEETVILPETTVECEELDMDEDGTPDDIFAGMLPEDLLLNDNTEYAVVYNGTRYLCKSVLTEKTEEGRVVALGNLGALDAGATTSEPFVMLFLYYPSVGCSVNQFIGLDGSASVTLSIAEVKHTPIPMQYMNNAFPYCIEVTGVGTDDDPYVCNDTVANVEAIYNSGRNIVLRNKYFADSYKSVYITQNYSLSMTYERTGDENSLSPFGLTFGFTFVAQRTSSSNSFISACLCLIPLEDGTYRVSNSLGD